MSWQRPQPFAFWLWGADLFSSCPSSPRQVSNPQLLIKAAADGGTFIMTLSYSGKPQRRSDAKQPSWIGRRATVPMRKKWNLAKIPLHISLLTCALQLVLHMIIALHDAHQLFFFGLQVFHRVVGPILTYTDKPARKDKQFCISRSW